MYFEEWLRFTGSFIRVEFILTNNAFELVSRPRTELDAFESSPERETTKTGLTASSTYLNGE